MTKVKSAKRALMISTLSVLMCVSMLIGTTFAWFTDTSSAAVNTIKAGTLKIDIIDDTTDARIENTGLKFESSDGVTKGENILWEPGATYKTEGFRIKNNGTLALTYKLIINGVSGDSALIEAIEFKIVKADGTEIDLASEINLAAGSVSDVLYIQGKMKTTAGNDCQGKTLTGLGVTVYAKQAMAEKDSIDDTYDRDAEYDATQTTPTTPNFNVYTATQLQAVLTQNHGTDREIILNIDSDIQLASDEVWTPFVMDSSNGIMKITINGNNHTIKGLNDGLLGYCYFGNVEVEINDLTLQDVTIEKHNSDYNPTRRLGYGAFGYAFDNCKKVVFNNCHIKNANISDDSEDAKKVTGIGGFIGYSSSADVQFNNCSVTDSVITAAHSSVGGVVGHTSAGSTNKTTINNITVKNCEIKGESTAKSGYVVGTVNDGTTVITTKNCANNKVFDISNSTAIYGRFAHSNIGSLTVDNTVISR